MGKRLYLHLGAHRTGSTYIQEFFRRNADRFSQEGVVYRRLHDFPALRKKVLAARRDKVRLESAYAEVFNEVESLLSSADSVFFSYEGFLGDIYLDRSGVIYPDTEVFCRSLASFLERLVPDVEIRAGFCTRSYASFITSTYMYAVRQGYTMSLDEYLRKIDVDRVSWVEVVNRLKEVLGANLTLWDFDQFKRDPWAVLHQLIECLGVDADALYSKLDIDSKASNSTAGVHSVEVQRSFNQSLSKADVPESVRKKVRAGVNRKITQLLAKHDTKLEIDDPKLLEFLNRRYASDLSHMENFHGI